MRTLICRALLLAGVAGTLPTMAVADPVTVTISTVGSGYLTSLTNTVTTFSNSTLTAQAFFTTEELTACLAIVEACRNDQGDTFIAWYEGLTATITVAGLGTYVLGSSPIAIATSGYLSVGDVEGNLYLNVENPVIPSDPFFTSLGPITGPIIEMDLGANCVEKKPGYCPVSFLTNGGELVLTSVADTATGEVQVGAASSVPEPETLGLVGMGMLGVSGFLRRRLRRRRA